MREFKNEKKTRARRGGFPLLKEAITNPAELHKYRPSSDLTSG